MPDIVVVDSLVKHYGKVRAVDGVSFSVAEGEIFGLVGPNGAGKTTTWEILEGLRPADAGGLRVAGVDVRKNPKGLRPLIGVQLQSTALFERLTVRETLDVFGALYPKHLPSDDLIALANLEEKADAMTDHLSGGQRQRLAISLALVNDPKVVFLDEPTTGLDPQARRSLWDVISELRKTGKTILLTTHYMDEAERLCDRVGVMDRGKVLALDSPAQLIHDLGERHAIEFAAGGAAASFASLPGVEDLKEENGTVLLYTRQLDRTLPAVFDEARRAGISMEDIRVRNPSLDDVFLALTGRRVRE